MPKKTIDQLDVRGKKIFIRADFNVPQNEDGSISDDRRIRATLPTIESVLKRGGSVIVASHLGRPEGKGIEPAFSMSAVAVRLGDLLKGKATKVHLAGGLPSQAQAEAKSLKSGEVLLLENLRFEKGEKKGDQAFAAAIAPYADAYCNDAFGASHRNDASMLALPLAMKPKPCVAGLLLAKELKFLGETLEKARKPFVAILGGAKVSDKLPTLENLIGKVDLIIVGGAMAYTFLLAQGTAVGASRIEKDLVDKANGILQLAQSRGTRVLLPVDHVCGREFKAGTETKISSGSIPEGWMGLDVGPQSEKLFAGEITKAKTVVWNGPMGVFEMAPFDHGTRAVADAVIQATKSGATTIAGGGDTAAALELAGLSGGLSHVSTGGGASLEMLEGKRFESLVPIEEA
ncbi:MAG: phosphoglycerate kinase [Planctomycetes bacterium]|nr:phosphoglycerate kinase [Planctomycetota bacterium]